MTAFDLHIYFLERLIISLAFLIPLIITWWLRNTRLKEKSGPLTYMLIGFSVGFLINIIGGLLGAYVYQLPLLPLHLHQEGLPAQAMAYKIFFYNTTFKVIYIASLFASLLLVEYGIYKLALSKG
ncbi:MAG: hypothetical protein DRJ47_09785 [Thermoprotei archaeon]|nr:MAG: hypothetical protein DRJ47_09785 [Thermoprotei archaeon]